MSDLLEAAKAVDEDWHNGNTKVSHRVMQTLRAAIERAESDDEIDRQNQEAMNIHLSGVMAERERISARVELAAETVWKA